MCIKAFTLTHLSPAPDSCFTTSFKSDFRKTNVTETLLEVQSWNIAGTLGKTSVKAKTSSFTFSLREKNCPSAGNVGAAWQIKSLTGEINIWKISA